MDQNGAPVLIAVPRGRRINRRKQQIARRLAIGVGEDLQIVLKGPVNGIKDLIGAGSRIAHIVAAHLRGRRVIGPVPPRGKPLRRPINGEFRAPDAQPVDVITRLLCNDKVPIHQNVGIGHHIDLQPIGLRRQCLHDLHLPGAGAPLLRRGVAV